MTARPRGPLLALPLALLALAACATTVDDRASTTTDVGTPTTPISGDGTDPTVAGSASTIGGTIGGTAIELLPELAVEMSRLGSQIASGDGDDETLARIEEIWDAVGPEIDATRPELVNGIGVTVDMARVAVERTRPADADKAFVLLTDLVDEFTGDG